MTKILAENNINISAFNIADAADYGIARFIADDPELALKVLKENRFSVNITDVVGMVVPHEAGGLYKALQILSANDITIDYMSYFMLSVTIDSYHFALFHRLTFLPSRPLMYTILSHASTILSVAISRISFHF